MTTVPVLVITGSVGVGKTTVAMAASALLDDAGIPHALIDLDWLRWCHPSPENDPFQVALGLRNLAALYAEYCAAGARYMLLVDVVERQEADVAAYREALPGADVLVVRLRAELPTILRRLEGRDTGAALEWSRNRAAELSELQERRSIGDLVMDTDERAVTDIAGEVLTRAGWLSADSSHGDAGAG
ncbi:MAG TPA: hypothetical protein VK689_03290 [Armatimonadota bacterium]|nr:hypothetical protein [Armatimonadota bacterium]